MLLGIHKGKEGEPMPPVFDVYSIYYDGKVKTQWASPLQTQTESLIVLEAKNPFRFIDRGKSGEFPNRIKQFYWKDKWFNAFAFYDEMGQFSRWYCNIACPPTIKNNQITFIDLDLDVLWIPPNKPEILDREEFEEHKVRFGYPEQIIVGAEKSLRQLLEMIDKRIEPFNEF